MTGLIRIGCFFILGSLTACTLISLPTQTGNQKPVSIKSQVCQSWQMTGTIALRNSTTAFSAAISWLEFDEDNYQIHLSAPLGLHSIFIEKKNNQVIYRDGNRTVAAHRAEQLLYQQTKIRMPIDNLLYWIKGTAAPGLVKTAQYDNSTHQLALLKQAGYTINYSNYSATNGFTYPKYIKLQGNGITIKLVIKQWKISD